MTSVQNSACSKAFPIMKDVSYNSIEPIANARKLSVNYQHYGWPHRNLFHQPSEDDEKPRLRLKQAAACVLNFCNGALWIYILGETHTTRAIRLRQRNHKTIDEHIHNNQWAESRNARKFARASKSEIIHRPFLTSSVLFRHLQNHWNERLA
jgi:hypothetical protein